jgi:predicted AAA+ superfamily ATPase
MSVWSFPTLPGTNYDSGQAAINAASQMAQRQINAEARRTAVPITPVSERGDELYHILRKRIFKRTPDRAECERVASAYSESHRTAEQMGLTTTTPASVHASLLETYPFHYGFTDLFGKFKENEGFQQTRGIIRLMQILVADLWTNGKADSLELIHPYDLDFNANEVSSELGAINNSLNSAISHDIADSGRSEAEQIDVTNGTTDASDASKLILLASLSTTGMERVFITRA